MTVVAIGDEDAFEASFQSMGALIELRWMGGPVKDADSVLQRMQRMAGSWVEVLSNYEQDSECLQLCRAADALDWVTPSPELWQMIEACDRWYHLSEGAFDASLGAITQLRRRKREATEQQWEQARERCGWNHLALDQEQRRLRFLRSGLRFDFGAIGKGFVADRLGEAMRDMGIDRYCINASGNMLCGEGPVDSTTERSSLGWPVTIGLLGHPDRELKRIRLARCGIATSGDQYQRFRDGATRTGESLSSHIVDPLARRGLDRPCMATVISPTASDADAMATACCVHMQRGSINNWLARIESDRESMEIVLQSQAGASVAMTVVNGD